MPLDEVVISPSITATRSVVPLKELSVKFSISQRQIEYARARGERVYSVTADQAAIRLGFEEDSAILSDVLGNPKVKTMSISSWDAPGSAVNEVSNAVNTLYSNYIPEPYILFVSSGRYTKLLMVIEKTGIMELTRVKSLVKDVVIIPQLRDDTALLLSMHQSIIDLALGVDTALVYLGPENGTHGFVLWETLAVRVKDPRGAHLKAGLIKWIVRIKYSVRASPLVGFVNLLINIFNYIGIMAFAASGAFKAYEKNLDILGGIVLGSSVALAGGIIRDVLIGIFPPTNIVYLPYPVTAIAASLIAYVFYPCISKYRNALMYADAIGLGTFSAVGAEIATEHGLNVLGVVLMAAVTAAGGGVVRDVLAGEIPTIFRRDIYATVAVLGGIIYLVFKSLLGSETAVLATAIIIVITRFVIIMRGLDKAYITIHVSSHRSIRSIESTRDAKRYVNHHSR